MTAAPSSLRPAPDLRPKPKPGILDIEAYVGGKSQIEGVAHPLKLSSNENILGCSALATEAYLAAAETLNLYPDGRASALRSALAERFRLDPNRIVFGCGSDEIFTLLAQAFCEPGSNVVQGQYGFLAYRIAARSAGALVRFAPEPNFRIDVAAILREVDDETRIVYLANPANPTGTYIPRDDVRALVQGLPQNVILVLDGAYAEYLDDEDYEDGFELARSAPNIVVTRTFSKIHGLAALRVGWAYAPLEVADALERIRGPFNVGGPAQAAALAALKDEAFVEASRELVRTWRPFLAQQIGGLGFEVLPSGANFVLARFPKRPGRTAADAEAFLARRGILVRGLAGYGIGDGLRITVGLEEHNRRVVEALAEFARS